MPIRVLYSFGNKIGADRICYTAWEQVRRSLRRRRRGPSDAGGGLSANSGRSAHRTDLSSREISRSLQAPWPIRIPLARLDCCPTPRGLSGRGSTSFTVGRRLHWKRSGPQNALGYQRFSRDRMHIHGFRLSLRKKKSARWCSGPIRQRIQAGRFEQGRGRVCSGRLSPVPVRFHSPHFHCPGISAGEITEAHLRIRRDLIFPGS